MRRATMRTESPHAAVVAAALRPDNTAEMATQVDGETIETTIARGTTGGLRTTLDDYAINLSVAERVARTGTEHRAESDDRTNGARPTDDTDDSDTDDSDTDDTQP